MEHQNQDIIPKDELPEFVYKKEDIQATCVDKKKLLDAIEKVYMDVAGFSAPENRAVDFKDKLKKELGLEE